VPDPSISKHFGQIVRQRRLAEGTTQEALADRAKLHPTYIGMVERGLRNPSLDVCAQIAEALGVNLTTLVDETLLSTREESGKP
jgi:transcriptional regulator with XRE-family HTH domain